MREFHNRLLFLDLRGRSRPQPYSLPCDERVSPEQGRRTVPEVGRLLIGSEKVQKDELLHLGMLLIDKPNLVAGPVRVCWHKFTRYWDVEHARSQGRTGDFS